MNRLLNETKLKNGVTLNTSPCYFYQFKYNIHNIFIVIVDLVQIRTESQGVGKAIQTLIVNVRFTVDYETTARLESGVI